MGVEGEKLSYKGNNTILLSPVHNALSHRSVITHIIALLIKNNKIILVWKSFTRT